ncbi:MAG: CDP-glucose 4,6-dehydratase [Paracoccaceae bacterium]
MTKEFSGFFEHKCVLVTGHTGFKGSWLCHVLAYLGSEVHGIALDPEPRSHFVISGTESLVHHNVIDINDADRTTETIRTIDPEIILHLAAQPLVRLSYEDPLGTLGTNVIGSANVMEGALQCASKPLVAMITSDKCYENQEQIVGYSENEPMGGHDPYSASKGAAELIIKAFARSFFLPEKQSILALRGGNVIGGGDWAKDRIMTDIVDALMSNRQPELRNPYATRPWQHVLDVVNGYLSAVKYLSDQPQGTYDCFNIGPMQENVADVLSLAAKACQYWGTSIVPKLVGNARQPHEAKLLHLDISKALHDLRWAPKYGFDKSLEQTMAWYRAYKSGKQMSKFTTCQIQNFFTHQVSQNDPSL